MAGLMVDLSEDFSYNVVRRFLLNSWQFEFNLAAYIGFKAVDHWGFPHASSRTIIECDIDY